MQWILYNVAISGAISVSLIFWGVLVPLYSNPTTFLSVSVHAFNLMFMSVEQFMSRIPSRLLHVYMPVTYGLTYSLFTLILYTLTEKVVYPGVIDWRNPGMTAMVVCSTIFFYMVCQLILFLISNAVKKCSCDARNKNVEIS